ncbi:IS982 family transposase [Photorhabdus luminescens]|uniref:Transposase DDE domain-containing protein n=3 Tax=Photorhabdus TaxID=29487 RepID=A0A1G5RAK5_PHOLU|nr:IS982 family transposase [Photorhabdus luminescens]SCZ70431.1 Transposase DDE domain-containing protein [Photorhabdus luminescens]
MDKLVELFCDVDDFCRVFIPLWEQQCIEEGHRQRRRHGRMSASGIMTIVIAFHMSHYRDFKNFYFGLVRRYPQQDFPTLLSYTRFLGVVSSVLGPLCSYLTQVKGKPTGLAFVDSTSIRVCHNIRIPRHKVFDGIAKRGKGSMGGFFGFKLHLIVNHQGEIVSAKLTPGNVDDREPVRELAAGLTGTLYGDKGYISQALFDDLNATGVTLITDTRSNMKAKALSVWDKVMLSKRFIIETIHAQLKNISQIEHSRHRSLQGFMLNVLGGLIAYCFKENKPSLNISRSEMDILVTA